MWTSRNRARYDRSKLRYPSDVTDEEWELIVPLIPPGNTGAPTTPVNKCSNINSLEAAKTGSSTAIRAPAALRGGRYDINDLTWDRLALRQRRGGRVMATIEPDSTWPGMWRVR